MSDITTPGSEHQHIEKKKRASRSVTLKFNLNFFYVAIAVIVLIVVFFLGRASNSKDTNTSSATSSSASSPSRSQNRWTSVGTVQEVSSKSIKVKDSRNQIKEAAIVKETKIVDRKGTNLKVADVKKDQRVIISGEKDGDKLTATRIRIQL